MVRHRRIEKIMGEAVNFDGLACGSMLPAVVAQNARSAMRGYRSKSPYGTMGYLGLMIDFIKYDHYTNYDFFRNIAQSQASEAIGGIKSSWEEALSVPMTH